MSQHIRAGLLALVALVAVGTDVAADSHHTGLSSGTPSRTCLECHDGLAAANITLQASTASTPQPPPGGSHPVGVDYLAAQNAGWTSLRPVALLPPEIRLVDGRVECTSCHDFSPEGEPRLVLDMTQSRLCFGCHVL